MTNLLHPLAAQHRSRSLDVLFGGNEHATMEESAKLAFDSVKYVPKDKRVLYVNTLCDQETLDVTLHKYWSRRPRLLFVTWLESSFMERLETLEHILKAKEVATLVINSFEFAALTQRHRVELGQWLRRVRNTLKIRVILFMQCKPGYYGVNGSLRFAATHLMEVGSYLKEHSAEFSKSRLAAEELVAAEYAKENYDEVDQPLAVEASAEKRADVTPVVLTPVGEASVEVESEATKLTEEVDDDNEFVDDDTPWVALESDEDLYYLLSTFHGDYSFEGAQWIVEELRKRGLPTDPETVAAQALSLENKELEYADVV